MPENTQDTGLELRFMPIAEFRMVPAADGKPAKFVGRAAPFNSASEDLGGFTELIAPGAFRDSLANKKDIRALVSHDPDKLMGRTSSGTLRLVESADGLTFENDTPDTTYARDLAALAARGDIKGMSFGFRVPTGGDSWSNGSDGKAVRTLKAVDLSEISYVASPAYPNTTFSQRENKVDPAAVESLRAFLAETSPAAPAARPELQKRTRQLMESMAAV